MKAKIRCIFSYFLYFLYLYEVKENVPKATLTNLLYIINVNGYYRPQVQLCLDSRDSTLTAHVNWPYIQGFPAHIILKIESEDFGKTNVNALSSVSWRCKLLRLVYFINYVYFFILIDTHFTRISPDVKWRCSTVRTGVVNEDRFFLIDGLCTSSEEIISWTKK